MYYEKNSYYGRNQRNSRYEEEPKPTPHKPVLLDIMIDDRFVCQLKYTKRGMPHLIDGEIVEVHDTDEIAKFVEEQRPSLKGKNYRIEFATQKVIK